MNYSELNKRHICTFCGKKRVAAKMVNVHYRLLDKTAFHCTNHIYGQKSQVADVWHIIERQKTSLQTIELFSGSGHVSDVFKNNGLKTFKVELNPLYQSDLQIDILKLKLNQLPKEPFIIWASVPCTCFSILNLKNNFKKINVSNRNYSYMPITYQACQSIALLEKTLWIIDNLKPTYFFIENPRGVMRHLPQIKNLNRYSISYSDYGFDYYKPTDIFTNAKLDLIPIKTTVGKKWETTVQELKNPFERSLIPEKLIQSILDQISK